LFVLSHEESDHGDGAGEECGLGADGAGTAADGEGLDGLRGVGGRGRISTVGGRTLRGVSGCLLGRMGCWGTTYGTARCVDRGLECGRVVRGSLVGSGGLVVGSLVGSGGLVVGSLVGGRSGLVVGSLVGGRSGLVVGSLVGRRSGLVIGSLVGSGGLVVGSLVGGSGGLVVGSGGLVVGGSLVNRRGLVLGSRRVVVALDLVVALVALVALVGLLRIGSVTGSTHSRAGALTISKVCMTPFVTMASSWTSLPPLTRKLPSLSFVITILAPEMAV